MVKDLIRRRLKPKSFVIDIQKNILNKVEQLKINNKKIFEEFNIFAQQTGIVGHDIEIGLILPITNKTDV